MLFAMKINFEAEDLKGEQKFQNIFFRLLHFGDRVYDPVLCQWMTPAWDQLFTDHVTKSDQLTDNLFLYRYKKNNPGNSEMSFIDKIQGN